MARTKTSRALLRPSLRHVALLIVSAACWGQTAPPLAGLSPEWTLEQARQCWQPVVRAMQHVGVPGYQFQTALMWDGALVFGLLEFRQLKVMRAELASLGETRLHVAVGLVRLLRWVDREGTASPALRRHLENGRLPIPHVVARDGDLEWDELVFAHLVGREITDCMEARPDDTLVTHAVFTVRNLGQVRCAGHLWLHFGDTSKVQFGSKCAQHDELAPAISRPARRLCCAWSSRTASSRRGPNESDRRRQHFRIGHQHTHLEHDDHQRRWELLGYRE